MTRTLGTSLLIVVTIALALGINVGLLSVTRAVLLSAAGVPDLKHLVHYTIGDQSTHLNFSGPAFTALDRSSHFGPLAIWNGSADLAVRSPRGNVKVAGALVNSDFFPVIGLNPLMGRFFSKQDDQPGGGPNGWSAVIGYSYWKTVLAGDPNIIGRVIIVNGTPVHVSAVLPAGFIGLNPPTAVSLMLPRHFLSILSPDQDRFAFAGDMEWEVYGRTNKDETLERINSDLHVIEPQVRKAGDPSGYFFTPQNIPGLANNNILFAHVGEVAPSYGAMATRYPLLILEGLAGAVLMLCLCNLALIFVTRSAGRMQDTATRLALGATRKGILKLDVGEALLLSAFGCIAAIPIAYLVANGLSIVVQSTDGLQAFPSVTPDLLLLFSASCAISCLAAAAAIAATTWHDRNLSLLGEGLKGRPGRRRTGTWIVGGEVFVATVLVATATFGVFSFGRVLHRKSGFVDEERVITADLQIVEGGSSAALMNEKKREILTRIEALPGIRAVATMNISPFSGDSTTGQFFARTDKGELRTGRNMWPEDVSTNYFRAAGTPFLQGRDFLPSDMGGDSVCVLSVSAATTLFRSDLAVNKMLYSGGATGSGTSNRQQCRVVGVVADAHLTSLSKPAEAIVYKLTPDAGDNVIVRAATFDLGVSAIVDTTRSVSPMSTVTDIASLSQRISGNLRIARVIVNLASLSAIITALIMAVGIFGVLGVVVDGSRRDIGVQLALGAPKSAICRVVVKKIASGVMIGLVSGMFPAIVIGKRMLGQFAVDAALMRGSYALGALLLLLITVAAIVVPLRRALGISPIECLRSE